MKSGLYRTVCGFCNACCGLNVRVGSEGIESIVGDPEHPVNRGYICPKAQAGKELVESPDRLTKPFENTRRSKADHMGRRPRLCCGKTHRDSQEVRPLSLVRNNGAPVSYDARDGFLHFMQVYGSPNLSGCTNTAMSHVQQHTSPSWGASRNLTSIMPA